MSSDMLIRQLRGKFQSQKLQVKKAIPNMEVQQARDLCKLKGVVINHSANALAKHILENRMVDTAEEVDHNIDAVIFGMSGWIFTGKQIDALIKHAFEAGLDAANEQ